MNVENVKAAIEIMKNAQNLDMNSWQDNKGISGKYCHSIASLHECGNSACFAGYIAISEEFLSSGGCLSAYGGEPVLVTNEGNTLVSTRAIAHWLGVSPETSESLIYGFNGDDEAEGNSETFYGMCFEDVEPEDVIVKLEMILSGELV